MTLAMAVPARDLEGRVGGLRRPATTSSTLTLDLPGATVDPGRERRPSSFGVPWTRGTRLELRLGAAASRSTTATWTPPIAKVSDGASKAQLNESRSPTGQNCAASVPRGRLQAAPTPTQLPSARRVPRCTKFLRAARRPDTAPEIDTQVDCSDCAAALVVFANVLGCDLAVQASQSPGRHSAVPHQSGSSPSAASRQQTQAIQLPGCHEVAGRRSRPEPR